MHVSSCQFKYHLQGHSNNKVNAEHSERHRNEELVKDAGNEEYDKGSGHFGVATNKQGLVQMSKAPQVNRAIPSVPELTQCDSVPKKSNILVLKNKY